jgi:hypothetical protein
MNNPVTIIFIALILVIPWLFVLAYIFITNSTIKKNYKSLADKYSFEIDWSKRSGFFCHPASHGKYRDIPVEICSFIKEDNGKKSPATYINAECNNHGGFEFIIVKKTKANESAYGGNIFSIGDPEFDSKLIVNTNDSKKMSDLLNFSIKYKLIQLIGVGFKGVLQLNGTTIRYEEKELLQGSMNLLRIEILLHLMCEISDEMKHSNS